MWPHSEVPAKQLVKAAKKLGLEIRQGSKHTLAKHGATGLQVSIPRHTKVKKETARGIIEFLCVEMGFSELEVAKALRVEPPILPEKKRDMDASSA